MTAAEIKATLNAGNRVFWKDTGYEVIKDKIGQYLIKCTSNGHCIGLTWQDGETLNGKEEDFYTNKILNMFDMDVVKKAIADCSDDEAVILCPHWSINGPRYEDTEDPEKSQWDWDEFEEIVGETILVSDYDDLIADPHGIYNY